MRGKRRTIGRKLACLLAGSVVGIGFAVAKPGAAGAILLNGSCSGGTLESPATLAAGDYAAVTISGVCLLNDGSVGVVDNLTVLPGASLVAAYAGSALEVDGNLIVESGGTLIMGCNSEGVDDACIGGATGAAEDLLIGNLTASSPLGLVVHSSEIVGSVSVSRGGGGSAALACGFPGPGVFGSVLESPVYTDFEDSEIFGNFSITNMTTCWIGAARNLIGPEELIPVKGNFTYSGNHTGSPDGNEIVDNEVVGTLVCKSNIPAVHNLGDGFDQLPNVYLFGPAVGQCAYPVSHAAI